MARYIRQEDVQTYGPELIDLTMRAAREAVSGDLEEVRRRQNELAVREQRLQKQGVFAKLDAALPNWREINTSPDFLAWLDAQHVYAGQPKISLLRAAFEAGDAARCMAFFRGYLAEHGGKAVGHAQASGSGRQAADMTIQKALENFYSDVRKGKWNGRDAEKTAEERRLHAIAHQRRT